MKRRPVFSGWLLLSVVAGLLMADLGTVRAQTSAVWGTIDTRLLVILHPAMREFDFTRGRFFRAFSMKAEPQAIQDALNASIISAQPKLAELQARQSHVLTARTELLLAYDREMGEIRDRRTTGAASATIELSRKAEADLQERLTRGLAAHDAQVAAIDRQIAELWGKTGDMVYQTSEETTERFSRILREIAGQTEGVARESGISFVIDTGWGMRSLKKAEDLVCTPTQNDAQTFLETMLFHAFTNWRGPREPQAVPVPEATWGMFATGLDEKGREAVKRIVMRNPHLGVGMAEFTPGRLVLRGGYDLTPAVARKMFSAYRIPEPLKNSYMGLLKDIGNSDPRPR